MNDVKVYEKPTLKFVSMRNEDSVANTCWGYHKKGTTLYYDSEGPGWMSFQIQDGSCTLNLINVKYYKNSDDKKGESIPSGSAKYKELDAILRATGGESGNPYAGEGTTIVPGKPDPSWS